MGGGPKTICLFVYILEAFLCYHLPPYHSVIMLDVVITGVISLV